MNGSIMAVNFTLVNGLLESHVFRNAGVSRSTGREETIRGMVTLTQHCNMKTGILTELQPSYQMRATEAKQNNG
jgi:hypothetical protein